MSQIKVNEIYDASGGSAAKLYGPSMRYGGTAFVNRIINGDMRIDQRNNGASGTAITYTVDRWAYVGSQASKGTWQQNAGGVTPPANYKNYLGFTSSSSYSVTTGDYFVLRQPIEAYNLSDFDWGGSNPTAATLSFWVRSSLTGTFGGCLDNGADRGFPFTYTISVANTWEFKTISVSAPASGGTWGNGNGVGVVVCFGLGAGSVYSGTAGSWNTGRFLSATGATSVVGTSGATFYITGVQLEAGTVATPFERRDYGRELMMCQRYFEVAYTDSAGEAFLSWAFNSNSNSRQRWWFKQNKRATPTVTAHIGWTAVTPVINPGIDGVGFYAANLFYIAGATHALALSASAEL